MLAVAYDLTPQQWRDIDEYTRELTAKIIGAIGGALKQMRPALSPSATASPILPQTAVWRLTRTVLSIMTSHFFESAIRGESGGGCVWIRLPQHHDWGGAL